MKRIVIVGAGFTGTMVAANLLNESVEGELEVVLIDTHGFARGLAYGAPSEVFKLNVRADAMGAYPESPGDFFAWLRSRGYDVEAGDFVPRGWYGDYLNNLLEEAERQSSNKLLSKRIGEVSDVEFDETTDSFRISFADKTLMSCDAVVLAVGHLSRASCSGISVEEMFVHPYDLTAYEELSSSKRIFVLGSSLTAVDCILQAEAAGFKGQYLVLSRHGRFPLAHEAGRPAVPVDTILAARGNIRGLLQAFRTIAVRAGSTQPVIDSLRPHLQGIWGALPSAERRRFMRHLRARWEIHRHRIPDYHAKCLNELKKSGRLELVGGSILDARAEDGGVVVEWQDRRHVGVNSRVFDRAFLCAGAEGDVGKASSELIQNLLKRGILCRGELGLGGRISDAAVPQAAASRIRLVGPLQREDLWEITAVRELRSSAQLAARELLSEFNIR